MQCRLNKNSYVSLDWFQKEQESIFSKYWIFYCLKPMVDKPNRFVAREINGIPIVVQNIDGSIRAFQNICLHRQNRLQTDEMGERRLICKYHGWGYGKSGEVLGVPLKETYFNIEKELCGRRLVQYAVEEVGGLIFINLSMSPISISEQFGERLLNEISSASDSFDREILVAKFSHKYNWKMVYENLRDSLHPRFLHRQTITRDVQIDPSAVPPDLEHIVTRKAHVSELSNGGAVHTFTHDMTPPYADKVERWGNTDAYFNWVLFPNTHIVSPNGGYLFWVEHHHPVSPTETEITIYCMTSKKKGSLPASVLWEQFKAAKKILDEDNIAMEHVQSVIAYGPEYGLLGEGEFAVQEFQNFIADCVERGSRGDSDV